MNHRPIVLMILDGFGYRESKDANAISMAHKPTWDALWERYPHTTLKASGRAVGLPEGQMGNSEVGHLTMGAGRIVYQDLSRISESIADGSFFQNACLRSAFLQAKETNHAVHILGLLSPGGVHSHEEHIYALLSLAALCAAPKVLVHPFLDGRDTPPSSARASIEILEKVCADPLGSYFQKFHGKNFPNISFDAKTQTTIRINSLCGRYYAMDRDRRWERIEQAYRLLTESIAPYHANTAIQALEMAYARGETDEFVKPTLIGEPIPVQDGDIVIFMNFRADRARQLSYAFTDPQFHGFLRKKCPKLRNFISLTEYSKDLKADIAFPSVNLKNLLVNVLADHKMKQLRLAETEKYAHVTFFFNGGRDTPFEGEDRILVPSHKGVATYDLYPEMSATQITDQLVEVLQKSQYDLIICNFANADMVGHSGNLEATVSAVEEIDACLGRIYSALQAAGGEMLITADHGNAECMFDYTASQPHTAHTTEDVPFIYVGRRAQITHEDGTLSDIAPTILMLLDLPKPKEMTGVSLVRLL